VDRRGDHESLTADRGFASRSVVWWRLWTLGNDAAEALLITGPCGAGKSTVGFACLTLHRAEAVQAAMVDAEIVYLSTAPKDPRNELIAEQGLAAVYRVYRDADIRRLLLPRVLLYQHHLELVSKGRSRRRCHHRLA
jgi:hypothetical protein